MNFLNVDAGLEDVNELKKHPENPNEGDIEAIKSSILDNGFYGAIEVHKSTNHVIAGNSTLEAVRDLGWDVIPVIWVDCSEERAKKILLADNRTRDLAAYNSDALESLLEDVVDTETNLQGTGYENSQLGEQIMDDYFGESESDGPEPDKSLEPEPDESEDSGSDYLQLDELDFDDEESGEVVELDGSDSNPSAPVANIQVECAESEIGLLKNAIESAGFHIDEFEHYNSVG